MLYPLRRIRIAVLGARSAPKRHWQPVAGSAGPGSPTRVFHVAVARDRDRPALVSRSAGGGPPGWKISRAEPVTGYTRFLRELRAFAARYISAARTPPAISQSEKRRAGGKSRRVGGVETMAVAGTGTGALPSTTSLTSSALGTF